MTGIDPAEWLNIRQAYSRIGVSYSSFYNAMYRNEGGRTPYFIHGGRKYFGLVRFTALLLGIVSLPIPKAYLGFSGYTDS